MKSSAVYDPSTDIPDLSGRSILVTGGTSGLGKASVLALARHHPAQIFFTGRNSTNGSQVLEAVKAIDANVQVVYLQCDQADLSSTENTMKELLQQAEGLDIVICNAGVMGKDAALTKDGFEYHFGINHLAHALMVKMLLPLLRKTASQKGDARVVFMSSNGFRWTPSGGIVFKDLRTPQDYAFAGRWRRYGQSKLANVVYAAEIAHRYPEISSVSVHPGVIFTDLWNTELSVLNRIFTWLATLGQAVSVEQGIYNPCWAATTEKKNLSPGAFYEPVGVVGSQTNDSQKIELHEELWTWTEDALKNYGHTK
ncbi:hypothetical protein MMC34_008163 [Xylographa carneopallida]|nr:hypothetical protein [Xylographa carneopallida]